MTKLRLQLLGPFSLTGADGQALPVTSRKARALLALLASRGARPVGRAAIASLLWERSGEAQARASLRQTLSVLSRTLAPIRPDWLIREGEFLSLNPDAFRVDWPQLGQDCRQQDPAALERALLRHRGPLLEGLRFPGPAFENWLASERAASDRLMAAGLQSVIDWHLQARRWPHIAPSAERLLALDPLNEAAHRALIISHAERGHRGAALAQCRACSRALEEHGIGSPESETLALFARLRDGLSLATAQPCGLAPRSVSTRSEEALDNAPGGPTLAVLPFRALSPDPHDIAFANALSDTLVLELRRFRDFPVISSLSARTLGRWQGELGEAARILGARYAVAATVWRVGDRVQVVAQLVEAAGSKVLWAERYQRRLDDLFALQDELARAIAGTIVPQALEHEHNRSRLVAVASLDQWHLLVRGAYQFYRQVGVDWGNHSAQALFERAITRDQDCAKAYAGLAYSRCLEIKEGLAGNPDQALRDVNALARHAVGLDNLDPWCHVALGRVLQQAGEYEDSIAAYQEAVALCPSSAKAHFGLSYGLTAIGRQREAVQEIQQAMRLSPRDPMAWSFFTVRALAQNYAERFDEAEGSAQQSRRRPLANHWAYVMRVPALMHLGRREEALSALNRARRMKPELTVRMVAEAFPVQHPGQDLAIRDGLVEAGLPNG